MLHLLLPGKVPQHGHRLSQNKISVFQHWNLNIVRCFQKFLLCVLANQGKDIHKNDSCGISAPKCFPSYHSVCCTVFLLHNKGFSLQRTSLHSVFQYGFVSAPSQVGHPKLVLIPKVSLTIISTLHSGFILLYSSVLVSPAVILTLETYHNPTYSRKPIENDIFEKSIQLYLFCSPQHADGGARLLGRK